MSTIRVPGFARKAVSAVLLAFFGASPILPAILSSDGQSKLPACCRRDGKHRCDMAMQEEPKSGPSMQASRCASYPTVRAVTARGGLGLPEVGVPTAAASRLEPVLPAKPASRSTRFPKSHRLRGPPSL